MKKSLIALAVAGAFAAPAFAATSNVDVYGIINIAVESNDTGATSTNGKEDIAVINNTSRIGFKGSEDLGGGLKAIWQIEQGLGTDAWSIGSSKDANGVDLASRNTFIGLAGNFGTVVMGRHDTPYKLSTGFADPFADTIADYNQGRLDGVDLIDKTHDARAQGAVAYISPNFSGFSFAAAVVMEAANTTDALQKNGEDMDAYSLSANYANGPLQVGVGYQDSDKLDSQAWKIAAAYTIADLTVSAVYEDVENAAGTAGNDRDSWLVAAKYAMGPIALKAVYGQADKCLGLGSYDQDMWAIGADYALSKRTTAYVVYGQGDDDGDGLNGTTNDDAAGWNIGIKHSF